MATRLAWLILPVCLSLAACDASNCYPRPLDGKPTQAENGVLQAPCAEPACFTKSWPILRKEADACVHQTAWDLSSERDSADVIVSVVMNRCSLDIQAYATVEADTLTARICHCSNPSMWSLSLPPNDPRATTVNGERDDIENRVQSDFKADVLDYVVAVRNASRCRVW